MLTNVNKYEQILTNVYKSLQTLTMGVQGDVAMKI